MRRLDYHSPPASCDLDRVAFKSLYSKEIYDAPTSDGWVLRVSRYKPVPQAWHQPILGQPLLLVPGWSQNRHAFTCGDFVKQLLAYGADIHIIELRVMAFPTRSCRSRAGCVPGTSIGTGTSTATSCTTFPPPSRR